MKRGRDSDIILREMISRRARLLDSSGIRKVFDLARKLENPINLSIGQPDFDVPEEIKESAVSAIRDGFNRYTVTQGIEELRQRIVEKVRETRGFEGEVIVTCGVSGALVLAFGVLIEPGDEVVFGDPYFVMYKHLVNFFGGVPVPVDTYPDFRLTAERLEPCLSERTKFVILSSPANPTGVALGEGELREIADLLRRRGVLVISDEIYEAYTYDSPHSSITSFYENTLLMSGFSKSYAMTGWRIGYAVGPAEIVHEMIKIQQYSFVCAPAFAQKAAMRALELQHSDFLQSYRRKRDLIYEGLRDCYEVEKPEGAFYIFPRVPFGNDEEFVAKAIERGLLIIPGSVFSEKDTHFRVSFSAPDETIERGIEILGELAGR